MKQATRDRIAAAAARKAAGERVHVLYDCTAGVEVPIADVGLDGVELADQRILYECAGDEAVSVEFREDLFMGWELMSGSYFAGAVHGSSVLLYDSREARYYQYVLH